MKTLQRWWDENSTPREKTSLMREQVAEFADVPIPRIGEHVYTHEPSHEWIVKMVRYNIEKIEDAFVVDVQLVKLW